MNNSNKILLLKEMFEVGFAGALPLPHPFHLPPPPSLVVARTPNLDLTSPAAHLRQTEDPIPVISQTWPCMSFTEH